MSLNRLSLREKALLIEFNCTIIVPLLSTDQLRSVEFPPFIESQISSVPSHNQFQQRLGGCDSSGLAALQVDVGRSLIQQ